MCKEVTTEDLLKNYFIVRKEKQVTISQLREVSQELNRALDGKVDVSLTPVALKLAIARNRGVFKIQNNSVVVRGIVRARYLNMGIDSDTAEIVRSVVAAYKPSAVSAVEGAKLKLNHSQKKSRTLPATKGFFSGYSAH